MDARRPLKKAPLLGRSGRPEGLKFPVASPIALSIISRLYVGSGDVTDVDGIG